MPGWWRFWFAFYCCAASALAGGMAALLMERAIGQPDGAGWLAAVMCLLIGAIWTHLWHEGRKHWRLSRGQE